MSQAATKKNNQAWKDHKIKRKLFSSQPFLFLSCCLTHEVPPFF